MSLREGCAFGVNRNGPARDPAKGFSRSETPTGPPPASTARGIAKPAGDGNLYFPFINKKKKKKHQTLNLPFVSNRNKRRKKTTKKHQKKRKEERLQPVPQPVTQNRAVLGNLTPRGIQLMYSCSARRLPDASPSPNCP